MRSVSSFTLLSIAFIGCWFDIGDVDSSSTQTSSSGGVPVTTSSGPGGQGGDAGAAVGGRGQGGLGGGDGGKGGALLGGGGSGPVPEPFQSCAALGYVGACAGPTSELLFFFEELYTRPMCGHTPTVSEACYINDCTLTVPASQCGPRETGTCDDLRCGVLGTASRCPSNYAEAGECLHNVAIRKVSEIDCEFRDCSLVAGWECRDSSDGVPDANCFAL